MRKNEEEMRKAGAIVSMRGTDRKGTVTGVTETDRITVQWESGKIENVPPMLLELVKSA